ncbi:hypothetical protein SAMN05421854_109356 [Amycolatopsis rubida]|uniref:Uncharacterized protein n=1 Tax=Amycolatopsis rubida TaxID=112413 RepID=A0A1I5WQY3_9PSEU|nr:hypothetical protein SAMN05421854_109356 [Amycolatopsis rubida]
MSRPTGTGAGECVQAVLWSTGADERGDWLGEVVAEQMQCTQAIPVLFAGRYRDFQQAGFAGPERRANPRRRATRMLRR